MTSSLTSTRIHSDPENISATLHGLSLTNCQLTRPGQFFAPTSHSPEREHRHEQAQQCGAPR